MVVHLRKRDRNLIRFSVLVGFAVTMLSTGPIARAPPRRCAIL